MSIDVMANYNSASNNYQNVMTACNHTNPADPLSFEGRNDEWWHSIERTVISGTKSTDQFAQDMADFRTVMKNGKINDSIKDYISNNNLESFVPNAPKNDFTMLDAEFQLREAETLVFGKLVEGMQQQVVTQVGIIQKDLSSEMKEDSDV